MQMPFKMYNCIYRAAWKETMDKAREAEEAEKKALEEEKLERQAASRGGGAPTNNQFTSRQMIENLRNKGGTIGGDIDLDDVADELGIT